MRARSSLVWSLLLLSLGPASASAQWTGVAPGVEYLARTDPGPNRVRAIRIDLCTAGVRMRATATGERGQITSRWAESTGVVAAINGGYFLSGYRPDGGRAAGAGAEWPDSTDTAARGAFSFGRGQSAHTEAHLVEALPPWAEEAVNGDATLVNGGAAVNCGGCGGGRAPRTAVGITADRRTLYLVTVDGRTSSSIGVTIDQLAVLMASFGVDRAMNLDGGGSTTMWVAGRGVVNVPSDGAQRTVSNHLGVFARGPGQAAYHCPTGYSAQHVGSEFEGDTTIPIEVGTTRSGALTFRNTGTQPWSTMTRLAPTPRDVASPVAASTWLSPTRIASPDTNVAPGEIGRFAFDLAAPTTPGTYRMTFTMVEDGVTWFADSWGPTDDTFFVSVVATPPPDFRAEIVAVEGVPEGPWILERGERTDVTLEVRNTGSAAWAPELVRLGTTGPRDRESSFASDTWINSHRAAGNDVEVPVGGVFRFTFTLEAPEALGEHVETLGLVAEGVAWFGDRGGPADDALRLAITVVEGRPDAGLRDGGATPRADAGSGPDAGPRDELVAGCGCRAAGSRRGPWTAPGIGLVALALTAARRARRR